MKDYTWSMTAKNEAGETVLANNADRGRGYRQSWYKTEAAARTAMNRWLEWWIDRGYTEIVWKLSSRSGVIETNA